MRNVYVTVSKYLDTRLLVTHKQWRTVLDCSCAKTKTKTKPKTTVFVYSSPFSTDPSKDRSYRNKRSQSWLDRGLQ